MSRLIEQIKEDEGFRGEPYDDSLGIPTIGIGTRLPLTEEEAELIMKSRLNQKIDHLLSVKPIILRLPQEKQEALFNMAYQLGVNGLLKFKKMWEALEDFNYELAGIEARDSRWYTQTPNRAEKVARILEA